MIRFRVFQLIAAAILVHSASAEVITVTTSADVGDGSLREAIAEANGNGGPDTIVFAANLTDPIFLDSGHLSVTASEHLVINGENLAHKIYGSGLDRIFTVGASASLELIGLTLSNGQGEGGDDGIDAPEPTEGQPGGDGGAIHNLGSLIVRNSIIESSYAGNGGRGGNKEQGGTADASGDGGGGGRGGAIYSEGFLKIENSSFVSNRAGLGGAAGNLESGASGTIGTPGVGGSGGAIHVEGGRLEIVNSMIATNWAGSGGVGGGNQNVGTGGTGGRGGDGGGLAINEGELVVIDSTVSGNLAGGGGAGGSGNINGGGGNGGNGGGVWGRLLLPEAGAHFSGTLINSNRAGNGPIGGDSNDPNGGHTGTDGGSGGSGGGLFLSGSSGAVLKFRNSTVVSNLAGEALKGGDGSANDGTGGNGGDAGNGGGIALGPTGSAYEAEFVHMTIYSNIAGAEGPAGSGNTPGSAGAVSAGGGIWVGGEGDAPEVTLANSVVVFNEAKQGVDVSGVLTELGENFTSADGDPQLGELADNGGPTRTITPLLGSPLINGGGTLAEPLSTDQRGRPRPVAGAPDIGALEVKLRPDIRIGLTANPAAHRGNNLYNLTGAGQFVAIKLKAMRRRSFFVSLENDGDLAEPLTLYGTRANRTLAASVFRLSGGRVNVTSQMLSGHTVPNVAPGAIALFQGTVKARTKKRRARQTLIYRCRGTASALVDTAQSRITQQKPKKKRATK